MKIKDIENMLKAAPRKVRPGRWFALKMRYRLWKKSLELRAGHLQRPYRFRFAGALLLVFLTLGSGLGAYAYASPEVTALHPLYPVKQSIESAELYLAGDAQVKTKVRLKHALRRMAEMEILSRERELKESVNATGDAHQEEGMQKTLKSMRHNMEQSLQSASEEEKPDVAESVVTELHDDFEQLDKKLGLLEQKQHLKKAKIVRDDVNRVRNFAQKKIRRAEKVRGEIQSARKAHKPRVVLKHLIMDENEAEVEPRIPQFPKEHIETEMETEVSRDLLR